MGKEGFWRNGVRGLRSGFYSCIIRSSGRGGEEKVIGLHVGNMTLGGSSGPTPNPSSYLS
jgi:hypothetical protein